MNFRCCVKVWTFSNVSKSQKICYFWIHFSFYSIRAVTTSTMVDCGSPWLRITKIVD